MAVRITVPGERRAHHRKAGDWQDRFVDQYLAAAAEERPDALALVDGEVRLTYRELERAVQAVTGGLRGLGVTAGEVVSWQLPNWYEGLILHHAVLRMGAVSNPVIPIYRHSEVGYILAQARSRVVVLPGTFRGFDHAGMVESLRPELPDLEHVVVVRPDAGHTGKSFAQLLTADPVPAAAGRTPDDPALLMFTSGTTSEPKGVLHTHNTLDHENRSIIDIYGLTRADVVFMASPITHITGMLYGLQLPSMLRTNVVLQDVWEPGEALRLIERHRCSFTVAATPFLHGLTHHPKLAEHDLSSLRIFSCGGADVPSALIEDAGNRLGCTAMRVYGSTEFPTLSTSPTDAPLRKRAATDGRAIGSAEYRIVDDNDEDVAPGGIGELLVRGPELFLTYLRESDNSSAFTPDGWFRTGDLANADADGYLSIQGRKKDIVLRGGENISVTEVEDLLFKHPAVREVAIVAMPDPVMVERACAFIVPEPGASAPDLAGVAEFLIGKRIAKQKIPERVELIDELPKTQSGKIQKFRLREIIREKLGIPG